MPSSKHAHYSNFGIIPFNHCRPQIVLFKILSKIITLLHIMWYSTLKKPSTVKQSHLHRQSTGWLFTPLTWFWVCRHSRTYLFHRPLVVPASVYMTCGYVNNLSDIEATLSKSNKIHSFGKQRAT